MLRASSIVQRVDFALGLLHVVVALRRIQIAVVIVKLVRALRRMLH